MQYHGWNHAIPSMPPCWNSRVRATQIGHACTGNPACACVGVHTPSQEVDMPQKHPHAAFSPPCACKVHSGIWPHHHHHQQPCAMLAWARPRALHPSRAMLAWARLHALHPPCMPHPGRRLRGRVRLDHQHRPCAQ
eukprot:363371-Chlamydomonas_euryale.AAC.22